jgi:hypothetical protein
MAAAEDNLRDELQRSAARYRELLTRIESLTSEKQFLQSQ